MSSLVLVIIAGFLAGINADANCMFKDASGTSNTLDLSYFLKNNITISSVNREQGYAYNYSPCQGLYSCKATDPMAMITRQSEKNPSQPCEWLSKWDDGELNPIYKYTDDETWQFNYANASITNKCLQNGNPDFVEVIWNCSSDSTKDYEIQFIGERYQCIYQIALNSKYACPSTIS